MDKSTFMKKTLYTAILSLFGYCLLAQSVPTSNTTIETKRYDTQKLVGSPIKVDGIPDEAAWNTVAWGGDFTQYQPNEGESPSQPTSFKILYDDEFLYVAYRCADAAPDSVVKRMSRRDEFPGDWVEINIDSYHGKRTAFSFSLSVSGCGATSLSPKMATTGTQAETRSGRAKQTSIYWAGPPRYGFRSVSCGTVTSPKNCGDYR